ncbi:MAG: hypothetical protein FWD57_16045 [Polyangiaceae bacterium]|nr:hypothetical protein [Polyangiaceae bacterium]
MPNAPIPNPPKIQYNYLPMQAPTASLTTIALATALLITACSSSSGSTTVEPDADGDARPDVVADSKSDDKGGFGGSDNPDAKCTDTQTECATACCDNETHVCNADVCEPKGEP